VPASNPFCLDITWLKAQAITSGYPDGGFHPTASVTRAALAAFLYRLQNPNSTAPACTASPFPDVPAGDPFCGAITWLKAQAITSGYPDGGFHPDASVTRAALAAFLYRLQNPNQTAAACTASPYPDVPVGNPFCGDITWLKAQSITSGYPDGGFHPDASVTREALAAFLHRLRGGA
jgi:hypothetical protein